MVRERTTDPFLLTRMKRVVASRADRRTEPRVAFDDKVVIWRRDGAGVALRSSAWALNLSSGGIRLVLPSPVSVGEQVGIGFRGQVSTLPGKVVWVSRQADGCVAGISFARN